MLTPINRMTGDLEITPADGSGEDAIHIKMKRQPDNTFKVERSRIITAFSLTPNNKLGDIILLENHSDMTAENAFYTFGVLVQLGLN